MRAALLISSLLSVSSYLFSQRETVFFQNFTNYQGDVVTAPAGWYFSYNGNYTSVSFSGPSGPNAYKFGVNGAEIVTPAFSNADTVSFWIKGAGTDSVSSLTVYETPDSVSWTSITVLNPLPTSGTSFKFSVQPNSIHLKFVYTKSAGNLSFDDLLVSRASSSGEIVAYFNRPVNNSVSSGVNAVYLDSTFDDTLVAYINRAHFSIDVAVYNFGQTATIADIAGAINNAYDRGVKIRWIYNGNTSNTGVALLDTNIKRLKSPVGGSYGIMHNKFMLIDAGSPHYSDPLVWTGSTNWNNNQFYDDPNNIIIVQDRALALAFTDEFNEMWGSTGLSPDTLLSKFGPYKTDNTPHSFTIGGRNVELYFSPSDTVNKQLLKTISTAHTELYFGIYAFTYVPAADSIQNKIVSGVYVAGIMDQFCQTYSSYDTLLPVMNTNLKVFTSGGDIYHNKFLIVDPCNIFSDPLVFTGSHNWSVSADTKNDENTLIVHDDTIANIYYQSFYQNFIDMGGTLSSCAVTSLNEFSENEIMISPNPSEGKLKVDPPAGRAGSSKLQVESVEVYNLLGIQLYAMSPSGRGLGGGLSVDLSGIQTGIYFLRIKTDKETFVRKVILR